jgi:hypothetical protein
MDNPTDVVAGEAALAAAASETPAPTIETAVSEPKPAAAAPAEAAAPIPEVAAAPIVPPQAPPAMPRAAVLPPKPEPAAASSDPAPASPAVESASPVAAPASARDARSRFALLAACVAVAASLGAIGGSLAVGGISREAPIHAAAARPESNDEVRALKESVGQLRIQVRALSDNVAALKVGVTAVNTTANSQFAKINEILERVERTREPQHRAAALPPAPEPTGSITPTPTSAPAQPAAPAEAKPAKLPVLEDWIVRRVYDGAALVEGRRYGVVDIAPGESLPGVGRVQEIRREDGRWVVVTPKGLIVQRK